MPITSDSKAGVYRIDTPDSSLIFTARDGYMFQPWWGARCGDSPSGEYASLLDLVQRSSFSPPAPGSVWSPDNAPLACPVPGSGDSRHSALHIEYEDGSTSSRLEFEGAEITDGIYSPSDLPHVSAESGEKGNSLTLHLADRFRDISVALSYSILENHDAIFTSAKVTNHGKTPCTVRTLASACMHLPAMAGQSYEQLTLSGSWARERQADRQTVVRGTRTVGSSRGISGHAFNPFTALVEKGATETRGSVWGISLVHSGDFTITAEMDQYDSVRVSAACGSRDFAWKIGPGESFESPQAVLVYSGKGIGEMSRTYHRLYRKNLCVSSWKNKTRPVLVNNWEATYFSFTAGKLEKIIEASAGLGIELFVLDDGWFGKRDSDRSSLGDWNTNGEKLPDGLPGLAHTTDEHKMGFGLWFEPEMISPDSDLYRAHPSWCVHNPGRAPLESRNQLVLDLTREDVRSWIIETISSVIASTKISYVKWDFNRVLTDMGGGGFSHRFTLGSASLMRALVTRFPEILFEGCSGGGGRFDPGVLHFMSQIWTSDDTDARERLSIQYGTSMVYPFSAMAAHVSAVPNHQCGRVTPLAFRAAVAMTGAFGYELDVTLLTDAEKKEIAVQIVNWKKWESVIREGDLYRLLSPFEGNETAWVFVAEDKKEALLCYYLERNTPNAPTLRLALDGLNPAFRYQIEDFAMSGESRARSGFPEEGRAYFGADLSGPGVPLPVAGGDYSFLIVHFRVK